MNLSPGAIDGHSQCKDSAAFVKAFIEFVHRTARSKGGRLNKDEASRVGLRSCAIRELHRNRHPISSLSLVVISVSFGRQVS